MGYVAAVYAIAVLCALISHYLVDDTVARIFNKKKPSLDEVKEEVKIAVKDYISSEKITKYPFKITTEELEEKGYLKELKLDNKLCAADIEVTKKVFKSYDIEFTCVNVEK